MTNYTNKSFDDSLQRIDRFFGTKKLLSKKSNNKFIQKYFTTSKWAYKRYHSKEGSVHMALNYDGVFDVKGYYTAPVEISEHITSNNINSVLELGCGKGFNINFLAKKFNMIKFKGIDITHAHIKEAVKNCDSLTNVEFYQGDFHHLFFPDSTFDLIYSIEAACYSTHLEKLFGEMNRVLKPGGKVIIYDAFRSEKYELMDDKMKLAGELIEKSMALKSFSNVETWKALADKFKFEIIEIKDISFAIMPNLNKLNKTADNFFNNYFYSGFLKYFLPESMLMNIVAGTLMPYATSQGAFTYNRLIFKKL